MAARVADNLREQRPHIPPSADNPCSATISQSAVHYKWLCSTKSTDTLTEFLESHDRNHHKAETRGRECHVARRKDNRVSPSRLASKRERGKATSAADFAQTEQAHLPLAQAGSDRIRCLHSRRDLRLLAWSNYSTYNIDSKEFIARLAQQLSIPAQTFNLRDLQLHLECIGLKLGTHFWRTFSGMRICQQGKPCEVLNPRPLPCRYADPPSGIALIPLLQPRNKFRG